MNDQLLLPKSIKLEVELPTEALAALSSLKRVAEDFQHDLWIAAFQQGCLWGAVAVALLWFVASRWKSR